MLYRLAIEEERRNELGRGALEHASHFGWQATAEKMLAVYDSLLSGKAQLRSQA